MTNTFKMKDDGMVIGIYEPSPITITLDGLDKVASALERIAAALERIGAVMEKFE